EVLAVYPEYTFNVRPLAPEIAMINGLIINFGARYFIKPNAAELHSRGVPRAGPYLQMPKDGDDPRILPMFSRRLAGRVKQVYGDVAILEDARVPQIALNQAYVEPRMTAFEQVGKHFPGIDYGGLQRELQQRQYEVSAADRQLKRLQDMLKFGDLRGDLEG